MNLRLTPAITIMAMLMMGVALITMAPHQAEAQSNHCRPLNLGAEIVNGDPVLTWDKPSDCTPASYDVWRRTKVERSWIEKISIRATDIRGTTYTDTGTEAGNIYRYRVQADGGTKISGYVDVEVPAVRRSTRDAPTNAYCAGSIWCATLTVQGLGDGHKGCTNSHAQSTNYCSNNLDPDNQFTHSGVDYTINGVRDQSSGQLHLYLESDNNPVIAVGSHSLIFHVRDISFPFHGADVVGDNVRKWHDANFPWGMGNEVALKITDPPNNAPMFEEGTDTSRDFDETIGDFTPTIAVNIGTPVEATDTDTGDTLTYSLEGTDAGKFGVDDTNGQLQTKAGENYDYETKQSYSVTLKVTDSRGASDTITVTLNVTDQDESTIEPTPADSCEGIWCATLTPQDLGDNAWGCGSSTAEKCSNVDNLSENEFTYAGVDYAVNGVRVRPNGRLELWINLDLNMDSRHLVLHVDSESFAFQSADAKGTNNRQWNNTALDWSSGDEISLRLAEPINIDPVFEEGTDTSRTFNETIDSNVVNTATNIGMPVTATDSNGDPLTYSLGGTNAGEFEIDDTNGQIKTKVGENYNYETKQSYSVTVIAEDGKEGTASINVALNVVDLNEAPLPPQFDLLALNYNSGVRVSIRDECDPATSITECAEYYQIETKKTTDQYWRRDSTIRPPGWPDNMSRGHQDSVDRYTPDIYTFNNEPLDTDVTYQFRVRGVRRGQHGEWSTTKTKRTIEEEPLPDPVIRLSFNEFETEYDSNGNVVTINRVDQIETLEGFDQTITIKAKCDPCHGLVHDITVPLHYTYSHPDIGEATVFQDRVTIYPAEEGTVKTVSLDWKPESNRVDLQGNQSVQIRFGKITFVDTTTRVCTTETDDNGDAVEVCEDVLEENKETIVQGLDIPFAQAGDSNGQGQSFNLTIHDRILGDEHRYVISNSAIEFPSNLDPSLVSGPTKTNEGTQLVWDMRKVQGIEYYDWHSKRDLTCHLAYMEVESTGRDLVDADGREQAEEVKWLLYPYTSPYGDLEVVDHGSGDNRWKRFTFTDIHTVGRTGTIANYSLRGAFNCPGIARYSETLVINSLVRLP